MHGSGHGLAHGVEPHALGIGSMGAKGRHRSQDDVGLDVHQALVVQAHGLQGLLGQVGNHHVGGGHQLLHDLATVGLHRVQRHTQLVACELQEVGTLATFAHWQDVAVLAAVHLLDANHLCSQIRQHGRAVWPGDVAAEVQDPDAFQNHLSGRLRATSWAGVEPTATTMNCRRSSS